MKDNFDNKIYYTLLGDVKEPQRAHSTDAGLDLFIPNDFEKTRLILNDSIVIPMKIKFHIPPGYVLMNGNKGGVTKKKGIIFGGGITDVGYEGEFMLQLMKVCAGTEDVTPTFLTCHKPFTYLNPGEKIIQLMLVKLAYPVQEIRLTNDEYSNMCGSIRGEGRHGSTGIS